MGKAHELACSTIQSPPCCDVHRVGVTSSCGGRSTQSCAAMNLRSGLRRTSASTRYGCAVRGSTSLRSTHRRLCRVYHLRRTPLRASRHALRYCIAVICHVPILRHPQHIPARCYRAEFTVLRNHFNVLLRAARPQYQLMATTLPASAVCAETPDARTCFSSGCRYPATARAPRSPRTHPPRKEIGASSVRPCRKLRRSYRLGTWGR
jgi:hypothetical protein